MDKCQIVDCRDEALWTELWTVGRARAFVRVCDKDSLTAKGSRTSAGNGRVIREEDKSNREAVDA